MHKKKAHGCWNIEASCAKKKHDDFTVLLRGAVNNHPRLSANNQVIRSDYSSTPVIGGYPINNRVIYGNVHLRHGRLHTIKLCGLICPAFWSRPRT
jgi:hypothetical protein